MTLILVVDDEAAILQLVQELLAEEGYETIAAHDGREALSRLADQAPDLVLADVMMPFVNGLELARAIHANPSYREIPVILMTAGGRAIIAEGVPHAAAVAKPFDVNTLLATLDRVLTRGHPHG